MKLACNWSSQLQELLEDNKIKLDYIKAGAYGDFEKNYSIMRSFCPVLLHGMGYFAHAGMKDITVINFDRVNSLVERCGSPHLGIHMSIQNADMFENMTDADIYERMSENIRIFKQNLKVMLLLENTPDSPKDRTEFDHYPFVEGTKFKRLMEENNAFFLLDVTHAKVTATHNDFDVKEYITSLPLELVEELHVSGFGMDENNFPYDTHQSMGKQDYDLLEWVLTLTKPKIVSLEYNGVDGETDEIIKENIYSQLNILRDIIR